MTEYERICFYAEIFEGLSESPRKRAVNAVMGFKGLLIP